MKNREEIDETTTIADMSMFEKKRFSFLKSSSSENEPLRGKNLFAFIRGTMAAALLIGLVYAIGLGLAILVMYLIFKSKLS